MNVAIFTDNDFDKINGVTTTLTAALRQEESAVGHFRTAPQQHDLLRTLQFAFATCQDWPSRAVNQVEYGRFGDL